MTRQILFSDCTKDLAIEHPWTLIAPICSHDLSPAPFGFQCLPMSPTSSHELPLVPLSPQSSLEHPWTLIAPICSQGLSPAPFGSQCLPMSPTSSHELPMSPNVSHELPRAPYGSQWLPKAPFGSLKAKNVLGF